MTGFERETRVGQPPAAVTRRRGDLVTYRLAAAFGETLRAGDPHAAAAVVDDALASGLSSVEIQSRVIAAAMWGIGELWELGQLTVAEEHLATAVCDHVLARVYPGLLAHPQRRGDTVVSMSTTPRLAATSGPTSPLSWLKPRGPS